MKIYGNIDNRIEEGRNYLKRELKQDDDLTMYLWSDRKAYYITKVVSQKNIFVKQYCVMADQEKEGGMGHQNWLYFKTEKEEHKYINECVKKGLMSKDMYKNIDTIKNSEPEEWVYRYGKWVRVRRHNQDTWNKLLDRAMQDVKEPHNVDKVRTWAMFIGGLNEEDIDKIVSGKSVNKYQPLSGKVSFGVKDYYYDWEF